LGSQFGILPKAPTQNVADVFVGEGGGEEVVRVLGLEGFVGRVEVELGDLHVEAELGEAIPDGPELLRAGEVVLTEVGPGSRCRQSACQHPLGL